ncbi:MAG: Gfo/Idh/MocA family oxidoreductase [Verrucomicrobia bacterium]|nr:Gfo/Idh/MocA family oxidoreductase [Verrucomicrobiota bacterium]
MKKLRVGIVGFGFVGPHHLDAIRRLGFAEVTGIATISPADATARATQYFIPKAYADWQELVADPAIDVVDVAAPTALHAPVALGAIAAGKHIIVDKPMALTSAEAKVMLAAAARAGVVNALTHTIRYNTMLQHTRALVARGDLGDFRFAQGHYLQEWLLKETDFNWRLDPDLGGSLGQVADAGAHWYDMVQHLTGRKIVRVLADLSQFIKIRQRPLDGQREAFAAASGTTVDYPVKVPDLGMIMFEFDNGGRGLFSVCAMAAGHKNDLSIELCGSKSSVRWHQERPDELWLGHRDAPSQILRKDPALLDPSVRHYAALPGGHAEAWPDAFRNLMRNVLGFIAAGRDAREADEIAFPTFTTGLRIARIVDAIAASAKAGGRWKSVRYS